MTRPLQPLRRSIPSLASRYPLPPGGRRSAAAADTHLPSKGVTHSYQPTEKPKSSYNLLVLLPITRGTPGVLLTGQRILRCGRSQGLSQQHKAHRQSTQRSTDREVERMPHTHTSHTTAQAHIRTTTNSAVLHVSSCARSGGRIKYRGAHPPPQHASRERKKKRRRHVKKREIPAAQKPHSPPCHLACARAPATSVSSNGS